MPSSQTFSYFAGMLAVLYFSGALLIAKRLEKSYPALWGKIGRPSLLNWGFANSSRLGHAMFFSSSLGRLKDAKLSTLVWIERVIAALILLTLLVRIAQFGHYPPGLTGT